MGITYLEMLGVAEAMHSFYKSLKFFAD